MNTGDVFTVVFIILGLLLSLPSLWLLLGVLLPGVVGRAGEHARARPVAVFFTGAGTAALVSLAVAVLSDAVSGPGNAIIVLLIVLALGVAMLGIAGLTCQLGQRLRNRDANEPAWREQMRGSTVLALAMMVPFLGWFIVLPVTVLMGAGAAVLGILIRSSSGAADTQAPAEQEADAAEAAAVADGIVG